MRTAPVRIRARPAMVGEPSRSQNQVSPAGIQFFVFFARFSLRWWSRSLDARRQNSLMGAARIEIGFNDGKRSLRASSTSKRVS